MDRRGPGDSAAAAALEALTAWTVQGADVERRHDVLDFVRRLAREEEALQLTTRIMRRPAVHAIRALLVACEVPTSPAPANASAARAVGHAAKATSPEAVRAAILERVGPWVLLR